MASRERRRSCRTRPIAAPGPSRHPLADSNHQRRCRRRTTRRSAYSRQVRDRPDEPATAPTGSASLGRRTPDARHGPTDRCVRIRMSIGAQRARSANTRSSSWPPLRTPAPNPLPPLHVPVRRQLSVTSRRDARRPVYESNVIGEVVPNLEVYRSSLVRIDALHVIKPDPSRPQVATLFLQRSVRCALESGTAQCEAHTHRPNTGQHERNEQWRDCPAPSPARTSCVRLSPHSPPDH